MHHVMNELPARTSVVPPAMHSRHALNEHRHENPIHADKRAEEVNAPPEVIELPAGGLRIPVINTRKNGEDRARRDDVMKVGDDVIGIVEIKTDRVKGQGDAGEPAD